LKNAQNK